MVVVIGAGQGTSAYVLHLFEGWQRTALYLLMLALTAVVVRLLIVEGRERQRLGRPWRPLVLQRVFVVGGKRVGLGFSGVERPAVHAGGLAPLDAIYR